MALSSCPGQLSLRLWLRASTIALSIIMRDGTLASPWENESCTTIQPCKGETILRSSIVSQLLVKNLIHLAYRCFALTGLDVVLVRKPRAALRGGCRSALPWADMLLPLRGERQPWAAMFRPFGGQDVRTVTSFFTAISVVILVAALPGYERRREAT